MYVLTCALVLYVDFFFIYSVFGIWFLLMLFVFVSFLLEFFKEFCVLA